ncbi:PREDICTED: uncharacterized protein LOC108621507 [Drosophila arizonae]|uniref:Uncharacterized protein LOC108621507 n=1 Tax=Drosophila arizonae TaxID=7263 RepID=A0ABM1Q4I4_DROAR|nr:PREDICTED: uncharacterized protein LOC108621507 [Drosophila arizonae]
MDLSTVNFIIALLATLLECQAKMPLFFPAASVYQITAALSVPVVLPPRKIFWDWGVQVNYELPSNPAKFYAAQIWEDQFARRAKRHLHNETQKYMPAAWTNMHPNDLTAGELYESIENMLVRYGFDETCLLRSVCELARHPFHDNEQNMLTALLTFTLTPSLHAAFAPSETIYRQIYEHAEQQGFLGADCAQLYAQCPVDFLSAISKLIN